MANTAKKDTEKPAETETKSTTKPPLHVIGTRITLVLIGVILALYLLTLLITGGKTDAKETIADLQTALESKNIEEFQEVVNINSLAGNVVKDVLLAALIEQGNQQALIQIIAPTLANNLKNETLSAISAGSFGFQEGVPAHTLLQKLYLDLAGNQEFNLQSIEIKEENDDSALAEATFLRTDLNTPVTLQLYLEKQEDSGDFQVMRIANLRDAMVSVAQIRAKKIAEQNQQVMQKIQQTLQVVEAKKSAGSGTGGRGKATLMTISFKNTSEKAISGFRANVTLGSPDGSFVKTATITENDNIEPGKNLEKTWPFALNPLSESDLKIFNTPGEELDIVIVPTEIYFTDGTTLKPFN